MRRMIGSMGQDSYRLPVARGRWPVTGEHGFRFVEFENPADEHAKQAGRVRRATPETHPGSEPRDDTMRRADAPAVAGPDATGWAAGDSY